MARISSVLFVSSLFSFAIALGNVFEHLTSTMAHIALNDRLYTAIHGNVQCFKAIYFSEQVVGKFEKVGGGGS